MKPVLIAAVLVCLFLSMVCLNHGITESAKNRPVAVCLGFVPNADFLKLVGGEHRQSVAALLNLKVMFYFGHLVDRWRNQIQQGADYDSMYRLLNSATRLDPYNADPYYFTQAIFTWDVGQYRKVNEMLEFGMQHRSWDKMLPFFAGFNAAYFLHDYDAASRYMSRAAEVGESAAMARLASRYFYESGNVELAIRFLRRMEEFSHTRREAELYRMRRVALESVQRINLAVAAYRERWGHLPGSLEDLMREGLLPDAPADPYGGRFFLDDQGRVRSTSNFALKYKSDTKHGDSGD